MKNIIKKIFVPIAVAVLAIVMVAGPELSSANSWRHDRDFGRSFGIGSGLFGGGTSLGNLFVLDQLFSGRGIGGGLLGGGLLNGDTSLGDLFVLNQLFGGRVF